MTQTPVWIALLCAGLFACSTSSGDASVGSGGHSGSAGTSAGGASGNGGGADCGCLRGGYAPVCGTDGQTYDAICGMECVPVEVACNGQCPCESGAGGAAGFVDCPVDAPAQGDPCQLNNPPICEYGEPGVRWCTKQASCKYNQVAGPQSAAWVVTEPRADCVLPVEQPGDCPEDFASVPEGECEMDGLTCAYPEGTCGCRMQFRGQAIRAPQWFCEPLNVGCPAPRPLLGTPCEDALLACDYGLCFEDGRPAMACARGYWMEAGVQCEEPPLNP